MTTTTDPDFDNSGLGDFFGADEDPWDRPERTEDRVPRDGNKNPRILPLGDVMPDDPQRRDKALRSYGRPSGYGKPLENTYNLERWAERKAVQGMMTEKALQLQWSTLGDPEADLASKQAANEIIKEAKQRAKANQQAEIGTAVHALSERRDMGLEITSIPEEYEGNLADWARLTKHLRIVDIECFVVEDTYKMAGTFDRLVYYHVPCPKCGCHYRILDLKTGSTKYGAMTMACQLGIYAHSKYYDPATGERRDLPAVCLCRGIIADIPSGQPEGTGRLRWINIAQGWNDVVRIAAEVLALRKKNNWWLEFEPIPDIMPLIESATSRDELNALYITHRAIWRPEHTDAGNLVVARLNGAK